MNAVEQKKYIDEQLGKLEDKFKKRLDKAFLNCLERERNQISRDLENINHSKDHLTARFNDIFTSFIKLKNDVEKNYPGGREAFNHDSAVTELKELLAEEHKHLDVESILSSCPEEAHWRYIANILIKAGYKKVGQ